MMQMEHWGVLGRFRKVAEAEVYGNTGHCTRGYTGDGAKSLTM